MGGGGRLQASIANLQRDKTSLSRGHARAILDEEQFTNRKLPKIGKPFRDRRSFPPLNSDFDSIFSPSTPLPSVQSVKFAKSINPQLIIEAPSIVKTNSSNERAHPPCGGGKSAKGDCARIRGVRLEERSVID